MSGMARIVFDLDGTLIDSAPDLHVICNDLLDAEGLEPVSLETARGFIGSGTVVFIERMRAMRGIPATEQDRLHGAMMERYLTAYTHTRPYPNVLATLSELHGAGHRLGICTNKPLAPTNAVIGHLGMTRFFAAVFGGDSMQVRKPDPAPLRAAFEALGDDGEPIYVGDSEVDAETAQRAGLPFLLFTEGYRKTEASELPHRDLFSDFAELPALIGRIALHAA